MKELQYTDKQIQDILIQLDTLTVKGIMNMNKLIGIYNILQNPIKVNEDDKKEG